MDVSLPLLLLLLFLLRCLQEHLFLVCELLRANLYEFQKYQRENGDEPYFTPPRIQRIATQVCQRSDIYCMVDMASQLCCTALNAMLCVLNCCVD
jgi:hypothetical protein